MSDSEIRLECLRLAAQHSAMFPDVSVVDQAQKFYEFLRPSDKVADTAKSE